MFGEYDAMEPDVVTEDVVAGDDVSQVANAALCSEVWREGKFDDADIFFREKYRVLGLSG